MEDCEAVDPAPEGAAAGRRNAGHPDETLFAAIIYVLVSGCAWRQLPPCFGSRERDPRNYLAFLGLAAALCCYKRLIRLTT